MRSGSVARAALALAAGAFLLGLGRSQAAGFATAAPPAGLPVQAVAAASQTVTLAVEGMT